MSQKQTPRRYVRREEQQPRHVPINDNRENRRRPDLVRPETRHAVLVVIILLIAAVTLMSVFGGAGVVGGGIDQGLGAIFGWQRFTLPIYLLVISGLLLFPEKFHISAARWLGFSLAVMAAAGWLQLFLPVSTAVDRAIAGDGGGYIGALISQPLRTSFGNWAGGILLVGFFIIGLLITFNTTLRTLFKQSNWLIRWWSVFRTSIWRRRLAKLPSENTDQPAPEFTTTTIGESAEETPVVETEEANREYAVAIPPPRKAKRDIAIPLDLLDLSTSQPNSGNIEANKEKIRRTLENFGIMVEMDEVHVGPTVTQFTLKPSEGVRLTQISSLHNDLALALAAHPIRIEAPIPGKSLVGIEVPNQSVALVNLRDVLSSDDFKNRNTDLTFSLGKDVSGKPWVADLEQMPHLLVAGATNSGKSVQINGLIISLLCSNSPDDLKLILVDPKRVELTLYNDIPHLLTPVITDTTKTINSLRWVVAEMDRRYQVLQNFKKRNIASYRKDVSDDMPYIVLVIDELADLMTVAANEVEGAIVRLAQMARAVGIHLVLATQRPSVDVITGLIKANITSRIAFSVASSVDSRTIIDSSGAEKLLGKGDMLFVSAQLSKPKRLQGAYVSEKEVERVAQYLRTRGQPDYLTDVTEQQAPSMTGQSLNDLGEDELLGPAKEVITQAGKASATLLQRRLRIGYGRAARILDLLEQSGFIGPADGARPREVYGDGQVADEPITAPDTEDLPADGSESIDEPEDKQI